MGQIGIGFEVRVSNVEETVTAVEPGEVVEELSRQKAEAVFASLEEAEGVSAMPEEDAEGVPETSEEGVESVPAISEESAEGVPETSKQGVEGVPETSEESEEDVLVIGADTVVALEGQILGKPSDREHAAEMLRRLAGNIHEVYTGVTLLYRSGSGTVQRKVFHERTKVEFFPMTEEEIQCYVRSGDCMDKAGAYGIQGYFARYVRGIEGDYNNVVGLPVGRLYQEAKEWLES